MTPKQVSEAIAVLVAGTNGWNRDAVDATVQLLEDLDDPDALRTACADLARWWNHGWRPTIGDIRAAYQAVIRRRTSPALPQSTGTPVPPARGIEIARAAYVAQCEKLGRAPDLRRFARRLSNLDTDDGGE